MSAKKNEGEASGQQPTGFEHEVRRLGEIVEQMESGELPLEASLGLFEEGVRLARQAQARLDQAERRVEELLSVDAEGNPVVRELDVDDD
jgi:exodeoxyribonuclease VII small subunit